MATSRFLTLGGLGGLGFLASVVVENGLRHAQPLHGAAPDAVLTWYQSSAGAIAFSEGLYATAIPCLLAFAVAGLWRVRDHEDAAPWGVLGALGLAFMTPLFGAAMAVDIVLNANAAALAPDLTRVLWSLKAAFFTLNVIALATGLFAMATAFKKAGVGPRALCTVAQIGALPGIVSVIAVSAVVKGSSVGLLGFVTFLCWLPFVAAMSISHLRAARS